ncbi:hypothetical protein HYFRA_00002128 [Hymenoscyphus fraxineus]|uniref:AB hydrolase-1 domain-containing protein n=1 Tax=Hymenoscyphus fraxineus TaxID=746836 RepID=A0A9N9KJY6_9HELO|nr:hypothetical protein HYFRA_00002128 [Hymenoscyphus fraxineus]
MSFYSRSVTTLWFVQTALAALIPWEEWDHQLVALEDSSILFHYAGSGPPLLLVHGFPEHSTMWDRIGPILAQNYTVIAVDNRGCGDSSLAISGNYTASAASEDLYGVLKFLNITEAHVVGHDKGVGIVTALAANHRSLVKRLSIIEYALPGYDIYEAAATPSHSWTLRSNWQLAFFSLPDVAEYFIRDREKRMLSWYFYHASYTGNSAITEDRLNKYATAISKPGFLRAGFEYFAAQYQDAEFFTSRLGANPLTIPMLVMGGEASFGDIALLKQGMGIAGTNVIYDVVPKAGHWICDENPMWVANRLGEFFQAGEVIPAVDLGYLKNVVTVPQQLAMGLTLGG